MPPRSKTRKRTTTKKWAKTSARILAMVLSHALTCARFVVEKILGHRFNKGVLEFDVKWQGYDNPRDRTWEPEENM